jgi:hypothetical protein
MGKKHEKDSLALGILECNLKFFKEYMMTQSLFNLFLNAELRLIYINI